MHKKRAFIFIQNVFEIKLEDVRIEKVTIPRTTSNNLFKYQKKEKNKLFYKLIGKKMKF